MRRLSLILLLSLAHIGAGQAPRRTAAELLTKNDVPESLIDPDERTLPVINFSLRKEGPLRLFAWISQSDDDDVLTVVRYDVANNQIRRVTIKDGTAGIEDNPRSRARYQGTSVGTQAWSTCLHDVEFSERHTGWITLTTHVNPSLGCTLLFDDQLQFHFIIDGWIMEAAGGWMVIEQSMRHFAPTHPATLDVFSPKSGELDRIYPQENDSIRTAYQAKLRKYIASEKECAEKNLACDVDSMDASVDSVHATSPTAFTFTITLSPTGMGELAEKEVPPETTQYIAERTANKWQVHPTP